jgi:hypothetical protein
MANHITNVIIFEDDISDEKLHEILETIKDDEIGIGSFDFNKLIPMPKELNIEGDGCPILDEQAYNNLEKYGHTDWYNWSVENWGTKWNSYGYDSVPKYQEGELSICFLTAWSRVDPILIALSERFPDVGIGYMWADDDIGSNVGFLQYDNGECVGSYFPEQGSEEAIEMACKVKGIDSEEFFCEDESEVLE